MCAHGSIAVHRAVGIAVTWVRKHIIPDLIVPRFNQLKNGAVTGRSRNNLSVIIKIKFKKTVLSTSWISSKTQNSGLAYCLESRLQFDNAANVTFQVLIKHQWFLFKIREVVPSMPTNYSPARLTCQFGLRGFDLDIAEGKVVRVPKYRWLPKLLLTWPVHHPKANKYRSSEVIVCNFS